MVAEEPFGERLGFGRGSNEIPVMNQKQDLWPHLNISNVIFSSKYFTASKKMSNLGISCKPSTYFTCLDELTGGSNKELNFPGSRIPKDLQDNYIQDFIHSWINQYENLNEN